MDENMFLCLISLRRKGGGWTVPQLLSWELDRGDWLAGSSCGSIPGEIALGGWAGPTASLGVIKLAILVTSRGDLET
jgi:hypothetical protein